MKGRDDMFVSGSGLGRICVVNASKDNTVVQDFPNFERLTSVHVNSTNSYLLASGYSNDVSIYDICTGQLSRTFSEIHKDHINISRFCNHSPHIFSTCSFDGTVKSWDMRVPGPSNNSAAWVSYASNHEPSSCGPIYSLKCNSPIVMITFSSDDNFILTSGLDNDVNQFLFVDGRHYFKYKIASTGLPSNYTRAYYSSSNKYILSGGCEENFIKFSNTYTGESTCEVYMYPKMRDRSLYIQVREIRRIC